MKTVDCMTVTTCCHPWSRVDLHCWGCLRHPCWLRSTVGGTPVFGRRTDPVLRSACCRLV